jgi:hypothetical protein
MIKRKIVVIVVVVIILLLLLLLLFTENIWWPQFRITGLQLTFILIKRRTLFRHEILDHHAKGPRFETGQIQRGFFCIRTKIKCAEL